jgi:hypothetical protein
MQHEDTRKREGEEKKKAKVHARKLIERLVGRALAASQS